MSRAAFKHVPEAEPHGDLVKMAIYFHPDLFEMVRRRAERERTSFGEIVLELVERGFGG